MAFKKTGKGKGGGKIKEVGKIKKGAKGEIKFEATNKICKFCGKVYRKTTKNICDCGMPLDDIIQPNE